MAIKELYRRIHAPSEAAPLAAFRVLFGFLIAVSMVRFVAYGWVDKLYVQPDFHFSYLGLQWVKPLGVYTYGLFAVAFFAALGVALGYRYRLSAVLLFLSFTYIEAMDKTTYLNHYYFISVLCLLLILLPANADYSLDIRLGRTQRTSVPKWAVWSLKFFVGTVYFYAGLAKLNSDWLLHAEPLATWLSTKTDVPLLGPLFEKSWTHFLFSWGGAVYDLIIPFLLLNKRTRPFGFFAVLGFHIMTRVLFPIGMFPWIMIAAATIFFEPETHKKYLNSAMPWVQINTSVVAASRSKILPGIITVLLCTQILLPWRYLMYPGELFWHEQGFRFSWRVMLMEKQGYASFRIVDPKKGESWVVQNDQFLTPFQEKQMSFQPDFILEYAHYLERHYRALEDRGNLEVYVDSYVALNGRSSVPFVDSKVDLTTKKQGLKPVDWLLPFKDTIYGL